MWSERGMDGQTEPGRDVSVNASLAYRRDIDGLRAVAVLAVVFYHAFPGIIRGGFIGVDVFFVISGYLISSIIMRDLARNTFSLADFYARRVRRIFPALAVVLLASLGVGWCVLLSREYSRLAEHTAASVGFLANFVYYGESGYFDRAAITKPLLHLWSLSVEEQFYIVWPFSLLLFWKTRQWPLLLMLATVGASFLWSTGEILANPSGAFYLPWLRAWELLAGACVAYAVTADLGSGKVALAGVVGRYRQRTSASRDVESVIGIGLVLGSALILDSKTPFPGPAAFPAVIGSALLVGAGEYAAVNRLMLSLKPLVWVGLISYPLYLWHWPMFSFAHILIGSEIPAAGLAALILLSVLLSWGTYRIVEMRVRHGGARTFKTACSILALLIAGGFGLAVRMQQGFPLRLPNVVREVENLNYPYAAHYREGECFLKPGQPYGQFGECLDRKAEGNLPVTLLWGDSHAAHLYPGLRRELGESARLAQYTASLCPPVLDYGVFGGGNCSDINKEVMRSLDGLKPENIIFAAAWHAYGWAWVEQALQAMAGMQAGSIKRVTVIGPVPEWTPSGLPLTVCRYLLQHGETTLPLRIKPDNVNEVVTLDNKMAALCGKLGIGYVSVLDAMCNAEGCLASLDGTLDTLVTWDTAHLTAAGSQYVATRIRDSLRK